MPTTATPASGDECAAKSRKSTRPLPSRSVLSTDTDPSEAPTSITEPDASLITSYTSNHKSTQCWHKGALTHAQKTQNVRTHDTHTQTCPLAHSPSSTRGHTSLMCRRLMITELRAEALAKIVRIKTQGVTPPRQQMIKERVSFEALARAPFYSSNEGKMHRVQEDLCTSSLRQRQRCTLLPRNTSTGACAPNPNPAIAFFEPFPDVRRATYASTLFAARAKVPAAA